jgi:hypothetical protein
MRLVVGQIIKPSQQDMLLLMIALMAPPMIGIKAPLFNAD